MFMTDRGLDILWGEKVKALAGYSCEICGISGSAESLHPHHVFGRANRSTRWYLPNGVCLCPEHHTMGRPSAHLDIEWFIDEMKGKRGEGWYSDLIEQKRKVFKGTIKDVLSYFSNNKPYGN